MLVCRIFSGPEKTIVEQEVNAFLREHAGAIVHSILQSCSGSDLIITLFYNVRTKAGKMKEAAIAEVSVPVSKTIPQN